MPPVFVGPRVPTSTEREFAEAPIAAHITEQNLTANLALTDSNTSFMLLTPDADTWFVNVAARTREVYLRNESGTYSFTVLGTDSNVVVPPNLGVQFLRRPSNGSFFY